MSNSIINSPLFGSAICEHSGVKLDPPKTKPPEEIVDEELDENSEEWRLKVQMITSWEEE